MAWKVKKDIENMERALKILQNGKELKKLFVTKTLDKHKIDSFQVEYYIGKAFKNLWEEILKEAQKQLQNDMIAEARKAKEKSDTILKNYKIKPD